MSYAHRARLAAVVGAEAVPDTAPATTANVRKSHTARPACGHADRAHATLEPSLSSFLFQLVKSAAAAGRGRATPAAAPAAQPRARRRVAGAKAAAAGSAHSKQVDAFIGGSERRRANGHE